MKEIVKYIARKSGYKINRITVNSSSEYQLHKSLEAFDIDLILDVGANTGQFAKSLRQNDYKQKIVSFEPLADAYKQLLRNSENDPDWHIHERTAIGAYDGSIQINVSGNSVSSSILPMLDSHSKVALDSQYISTDDVPIHRLDNVAFKYINNSNNTFLKIDTQGYEWDVLDGATETLDKIRGILCEVSLIPLYEGQRLWKDMIERLESAGFTLWFIQRGFTNPNNGRNLQLDIAFYRENNI